MEHLGDRTIAPQIDEFERINGERRSTWARRCSEGERGADGLTPCEWAVLLHLRTQVAEWVTEKRLLRPIDPK